MTRDSEQVDSFLREFFGEGNAISWEQYEASVPSNPVRISLDPWVKRYQKQISPFPLPRVDPATNRTTWYVLCNDPREARSTREALQAFVGPTYCGFNGQLATLDTTDPVEHCCKTRFGPFVFRLPVINPKDRAEVGKLLSTLVDFRDRESKRSLAAIKPIGRLLRDMEMAILANNEESAWESYYEIRSRGRLSATNLTFLQVRIYSAFEHWTELLLLPNLNDLLQVRRPKKTTEQIANAIYQRYFHEHEVAGDTDAAIEVYRSTGVRFQNLVRSTDGLEAPGAIKFALVTAIASDPPKRDLAKELSEHPAIDGDTEWANALLAALPAIASNEMAIDEISDLELANVRYDENRFDEAFSLYLEQPPTFRSVSRVLETAVEVDSLQAATEALAYLSNSPEDIKSQILARRVCTNQIEVLTGILGQDAEGESKQVSSLEDWFDFVDEAETLEKAGELLEYGIKEWISLPTYHPSVIAEKLQASRTGRQAEVIRNAVPVFIRAMLVEISASRESKPVYSALTELIIYDDSVGTDDLTAVEQLVEAILTTAPSHEPGNNDFAFAVEVIVYLWDSIAAPRHIDWALSVLDLLIDTGGKQHANLTQILAAIVDSSRAWARRVSDDQWLLLELLASDLEISELVSEARPKRVETSEEEKTDIRGILTGQSIAVYSLTERIARRFGQLAEQAFDGIKIHYVHDKSLTDRMKSLAQSADIFIVNTWDAKHAATNGIKDNRSASRTLLEPHSKSPSSLLGVLERYCRTQLCEDKSRLA